MKITLLCLLFFIYNCSESENGVVKDVSTDSIPHNSQPNNSVTIDSSKVDSAKNVTTFEIAIKEIKIYVGDAFNPLEDIEFIALDSVGNDVSKEVQVWGEYDTNTEGMYELTFTSGKKAKKVLLIVLPAKETTKVPTLVIHKTTYIISVGDTFNPKIDVDFTATDEKGDDAKENVLITGDYDTFNDGIYTISFFYNGIVKNVFLKVEG